jgi:hypothetical protein
MMSSVRDEFHPARGCGELKATSLASTDPRQSVALILSGTGKYGQFSVTVYPVHFVYLAHLVCRVVLPDTIPVHPEIPQAEIDDDCHGI